MTSSGMSLRLAIHSNTTVQCSLRGCDCIRAKPSTWLDESASLTCRCRRCLYLIVGGSGSRQVCEGHCEICLPMQKTSTDATTREQSRTISFSEAHARMSRATKHTERGTRQQLAGSSLQPEPAALWRRDGRREAPCAVSCRDPMAGHRPSADSSERAETGTRQHGTARQSCDRRTTPRHKTPSPRHGRACQR